MTFSSVRPICAAVMTIALSGPSFTQDRDPAKTTSHNSSPVRTTRSQDKARSLIDQILIASTRFSDDWLRLHTKNRVAETLWNYDKSRARRLFEETFRDAEMLEPKIGRVVMHSAPDLVDPLKFEMRKEILQAVSLLDGELAEKLVASIEPGNSTRNRDIATRQLALDREVVEHNLSIALNIAKSDPQRAARLARDSLNRVISYDFTKLIRSMRISNPELADQLFQDALAALLRRPAYISNKIGILAPYVFPETRNEPDDYSHEEINPAMVTRFLDFAYDALTSLAPDSQVLENSPFGTASFDHRTLKQLLPYFEKQNPKRAAVVRAQLDEILLKINDAGRKDLFDGEEEAWAELFKSSVPELLSKADATTDPTKKDQLISDAAFLVARRDGDFDKALPLIERIRDQQEREYILSMLRVGATSLAIKNGETDRAYRYASKMTDLRTQVSALMSIATKMTDQQELKRALEVVNETARLIPNLFEESLRAEYLLKLAAIASRLSATKGFEITRSAVEAINSVGCGPHWSGQTIFKDTKATEPPKAVRDVAGLEHLDFDGSFTPLARSDFRKALALAQAIRMKEASLLAQLAVCRGVLDASK